MIKDKYSSVEEYYYEAATDYVNYANDYFSYGALQFKLKPISHFKDIDKFTVDLSLDTNRLAISCQFNYDGMALGKPDFIDLASTTEPFIYPANFNNMIMNIVEKRFIKNLIDANIEEAWRSYENASFLPQRDGSLLLASEWCNYPIGTNKKKIEFDFSFHSRGLNYLQNEFDPEAPIRNSAITFTPTSQLSSEARYNYYLRLDDLAAQLFSQVSYVEVETYSSVYIGGIDENGHERKDNFRPHHSTITYNSPTKDYPDIIFAENSEEDYWLEPYGDGMTPSEAMQNIIGNIDLAYLDGNIAVYAKPQNNAKRIEILSKGTGEAMQAVENAIEQLSEINSHTQKKHDHRKNLSERE